MSAPRDPWEVLADHRAPLGSVEEALAELTVSLIGATGPSATAPEVVSRLVSHLSDAAGAPHHGAALISLLARLALGERPWPAAAESAAHRAVRSAVLDQVPRLLPLLETADARARHLLAHLLAWLGPSVAIDTAIRQRLVVEKYEAARASLLLAVGVRARGRPTAEDEALLRGQLTPRAPVRVAAAAVMALCLLNPALRAEPEVGRALRSILEVPELAATELAWNRGDLHGMARALVESRLGG